MPFITANTLNLYYERAGVGDPLLFISGTGGDLRNKPNMFDRGLPQAFDLIAYDQRGLGQSEKPDRPYTMADYADDAAALLDALNIKSAKVIGMSFGGMVAQELVLRRPEKVERLMLGCTSSGGAGGSSFKFHEIEHLKGDARTRHLMPINDTRRDESWQAAHPDLVDSYVVDFAQSATSIHPGAYYEALEIEGRITHQLGLLLESFDALICPTLTIPALRVEACGTGLIRGTKAAALPYDHLMTLPFNIASRCPVLNVPSGFSASGVPTGLQLVGRTFDDLTSFRIGAALERAGIWNYASIRPSLPI